MIGSLAASDDRGSPKRIEEDVKAQILRGEDGILMRIHWIQFWWRFPHVWRYAQMDGS